MRASSLTLQPDYAPRKKLIMRRRTLVPYAVILPALILIGLFAYHPVLTGMFFSFVDRNPCFTSTFLGLGDE
jgi:ABC-type sugar transport system permease subunit